MRTGESPPNVRKGHGSAELGPADSTDSGSDVRGGDRNRGRADRDDAAPVDQTLYDNGGNAIDGEDLADDASLDTTLQESDDPDVRLVENPLRSRKGGHDVERGDVSALDRAERDTGV